MGSCCKVLNINSFGHAFGACQMRTECVRPYWNGAAVVKIRRRHKERLPEQIVDHHRRKRLRRAEMDLRAPRPISIYLWFLWASYTQFCKCQHRHTHLLFFKKLETISRQASSPTRRSESPPEICLAVRGSRALF